MPAKLKVVYDTAEEIPEGFGDLFQEKDGKFVLTGVEGIKTQADIDRVNEGLRKERTDHKATKERLQKFGDLNPDELPSKLEELATLQTQIDALKADGKFDEAKLEPMVEARLKRALGPLEREKGDLTRQIALITKAKQDAENEVGVLRTSIMHSGMERTIRDAATGAKILSTAIDDAVMLAMTAFEQTEDGRILVKDNNKLGITPGIEAKEFFKDMVDKRPHWWPASVGGGSGGGRGGLISRAENPWSVEGWNVTKQGAFITQHGLEKAAAAATAVGSKIGNTKPTPVSRAA